MVLRRTIVTAAIAGTLGLTGASVVAPAAAAPQVGPDVSSHQHPGNAPINWFAVRASGQQLAMVKATESTWYVNPHFIPDSLAMRAAGLIRGTYHYADPGRSAAQQALFYATIVLGQNGILDLPPVLDLEHTGGLGPRALAAWVREFFAVLEPLTGRKTILYTYPHFWNSAMGATREFADHPLWIASYNGRSAPQMPRGGWRTWTFWQFTDSGWLPGVSTRVDLNRYNGSIASLRAYGNAINIFGS
ncbi:glycoside hydrolase family 25 protein [Gordonia rhizosphera]|uniref:Putative lysozyme n=1 Tax=Gordonia rhizosphera NBRC 16068 TaxID=1108045 RepID=K6UY57_9ACTN|nr:glycoside hydrolase family 25 protein [Gordonia rhizosphera]GAB88323.1 putative lysozyme [Gordonia rhizosphera NBRC 16068]